MHRNLRHIAVGLSLILSAAFLLTACSKTDDRFCSITSHWRAGQDLSECGVDKYFIGVVEYDEYIDSALSETKFHSPFGQDYFYYRSWRYCDEESKRNGKYDIIRYMFRDSETHFSAEIDVNSETGDILYYETIRGSRDWEHYPALNEGETVEDRTGFTETDFLDFAEKGLLQFLPDAEKNGYKVIPRAWFETEDGFSHEVFVYCEKEIHGYKAGEPLMLKLYRMDGRVLALSAESYSAFADVDFSTETLKNAENILKEKVRSFGFTETTFHEFFLDCDVLGDYWMGLTFSYWNQEAGFKPEVTLFYRIEPES